MSDSAELLPCAHCGSEIVELDRDTGPDHGPHVDPINNTTWFVSCYKCDATVRNRESKEDAVTAWNRRAPGWVSVDDRLPGNAERVLLPNNEVGYLNHLTGKWNSLVNESWPGRFLEESPKYWMPFIALPPPPTAEAGE